MMKGIRKMKKRIVTYDIKTGNDYSDFYELVDEIKAKMITESTYEFNTLWDQKTFESKISAVFNKGDNVHYISVNDKNELFEKKITI